MPSFRQMSAVLSPASYCLSAAMISPSACTFFGMLTPPGYSLRGPQRQITPIAGGTDFGFWVTSTIRDGADRARGGQGAGSVVRMKVLRNPVLVAVIQKIEIRTVRF